MAALHSLSCCSSVRPHPVRHLSACETGQGDPAPDRQAGEPPAGASSKCEVTPLLRGRPQLKGKGGQRKETRGPGFGGWRPKCVWLEGGRKARGSWTPGLSVSRDPWIRQQGEGLDLRSMGSSAPWLLQGEGGEVLKLREVRLPVGGQAAPQDETASKPREPWQAGAGERPVTPTQPPGLARREITNGASPNGETLGDAQQNHRCTCPLTQQSLTDIQPACERTLNSDSLPCCICKRLETT